MLFGLCKYKFYSKMRTLGVSRITSHCKRQAEIKYRAKIASCEHYTYVQLRRNFYVPVVRTASMSERKLP